MTDNHGLPAAIYVRISHDAEDLGLGVARQREDCIGLADAKGWRVMQVYEDNDVSATSGKPRPAYERMVRDIEAGSIKAVVVWDVDRLTRTPRELEDVIDWAERYGLQLANAGGEIDLATPQGRMVARMKGTVARLEVEQTSRRLQRKHKELAEAGKHIGPRPFGWDIQDDKKLVINEFEASALREAVQRVIDGETLWAIVLDFRSRGIKTAPGGEWQTNTLRNMLLRWRNCGLRTYRGKIVGEGEWDPIVSRELHERLVATLTDPARRTNNRGTDIKYLLTSVALCGLCGGYVVGVRGRTYKVKMKRASGTVMKDRHYYAIYACRNIGCMRVQRRMDHMDEHVSEVVIALLERDGVQLFGGDTEAISQAGEKISGLEAKLSLAADQFADDTITAEQLQRITARLRPQLDEQRSALARAMPSDGLASFAGPSAREAWEQANLSQRKQLLRALGQYGMQIIVDPIGSGNGQVYDPNSVRIVWDESKAVL